MRKRERGGTKKVDWESQENRPCGPRESESGAMESESEKPSCASRDLAGETKELDRESSPLKRSVARAVLWPNG